MTDDRKRISLKWISITLAVMFVLPFAVGRLASECAGMALCMMLFLVINPIYAIIIDIVAGRNIRAFWKLPLISAVAFLAGAWLFFDIHEPWFIVYAATYLCIGIVAMLVTNYIKRK